MQHTYTQLQDVLCVVVLSKTLFECQFDWQLNRERTYSMTRNEMRNLCIPNFLSGQLLLPIPVFRVCANCPQAQRTEKKYLMWGKRFSNIIGERQLASIYVHTFLSILPREVVRSNLIVDPAPDSTNRGHTALFHVPSIQRTTTAVFIFSNNFFLYLLSPPEKPQGHHGIYFKFRDRLSLPAYLEGIQNARWFWFLQEGFFFYAGLSPIGQIQSGRPVTFHFFFAESSQTNLSRSLS